MRLICNRESVANGEVSVLATIETVLAVSLVFYLSAHLNTLRWLAFAICVSPLLLLRTDKSTSLGIQWWDKWAGRMDNWTYAGINPIGSTLSVIGVFIAASIVGAVIRIGSTIIAFLQNPAASLRAIPDNWFRVTLSTDSRLAPEFIPEHPKETLEATLEGQTGGARIALILLLIPVFLPGIVYRWSLKATSIIYAPLVFVAHSTFKHTGDLQNYLKRVKRSDWSRFRAAFGAITLFLFVTKLVLLMKWNGFVAAWKGNPISEFLALYIAPAEIPKWQLAEVANSILAILILFFARHALLRYELNEPLPEHPVRRVLGFASGMRLTLALYTIVCTGYITIREARQWNWPPLGQKWIPWA